MMMKNKLLSVAICLGVFSSSAFAGGIIQGTAKVYRVVDGDTYVLNAMSAQDYASLKSLAKTKSDYKYFQDKYRGFRVRLANTDTAESVHHDEKKNSSEGKETSSYVKSILNGETVGYSCWDMGKHNRVICSISHNGKDFGLKLIQEGRSPYVTSFGKHPYLHSEYRKAGGLFSKITKLF